ncbi:MAG TPA: DinB family protein [Pyrinomonadaceae bacterium]|nr:DinB family protein [Pyrinomonadaceae bacterium]
MSCNSVEEIFENIDGARARLEKGLSDLGDGGESFRPEPGRWTVAEIVEHLSITEGNVVKLCHKLLEKAEAGGHARAEDAPFPPTSLAEFAEQARQKFTAPDSIAPTGRPLPESLAALRESRAALRALRPRIERVEGTAVRFPHPAFGPINLYQWLLFIGSHELRHLAQIEAVKQAMNVRAGAAD